MAQFNTLRARISLVLISLVMIVAGLGACSKSKNTAVDATALAPIQGTSDGTAAGEDDSKDSGSTDDDCMDDEGAMPSKESEDSDDDDAELALKGEKGGKGKKDPKECPAPGTSTPPAAGTGTASLADGQKIYAANCQSCHGALPGEMQGSSATKILGASGVGAHKGIVPWPAGAASNLSPQDAAASLAEAMK